LRRAPSWCVPIRLAALARTQAKGNPDSTDLWAQREELKAVLDALAAADDTAPRGVSRQPLSLRSDTPGTASAYEKQRGLRARRPGQPPK
jgi:hypothetical protein